MTDYHCSIASDYAVCRFAGYFFYFGYEETIDDEWAFVVKKSGKEIGRIKGSKLGWADDCDDCGEILLRGIARFGNKFFT